MARRRVVSHSAPYGHACMGCFKGKCRCIPRQDGDGCESKCYRLKRHCAPSNQVRRRAIHHSQESDGQRHGANRRTSEDDTTLTAEPQPGIQDFQGSAGLEGLEGFEAATDMHPFFAMPHGTSSSTTPEPLGSSPATWLDTFRLHMLPHFPFLYIPADMTAQQLHLRRPFLFRAITCVASSTTRERRGHATKLKHVLHGMVFDPPHKNGMLPEAAESTLDLLLGLLTYIAWGWDHPLSNRLTMLAMSLVGEMRLDMPGPSDADTLGLLIPGVNGAGVGRNHGHMIGEHSLEHQRAVLACFLLSSAVSAYSGQIDALRWTPQMEHTLAAVDDSDSHHDHILAVQVRLQLLMDQALHIRDQGHRPDHNAAETLLIKLKELRPAIEQHQGSSLTAHFHHTELAIHEALDATAPLPAAISACPPPSARPANNNNTATTVATTAPPNPTHTRHTLSAIQSLTTSLLSLPTTPSHAHDSHAPFRGIAFPQWAQLTRCVAALRRFETIPDPRGHAAGMDLVGLLDAFAEKLEGMAREAGEVGFVAGQGTFTRLALGFRGLRERVLRERAGPDGGGVGGGVAQAVGDAEGEGAVLAPQKGYFRNPRFWLDQIWSRVDDEV
ncbi:hypothetical protein B0I37DRAFT_332998 [Chaetomium sp. MPI-CAGE-AT-0009]|nr:hypothetical protein B0I37DRAFT_332998 [Chaetomium sp. MPI-CAGE-AT-0009]